MPTPVYATRARVQRALDTQPTARANTHIDDCLDTASRAVDGMCLRVFYPTTATRTFDWPNPQRARPWRLWFDSNDLISLTSITAGGTSISTSNVLARPDTGPPFRYLELDRSASASFGGGDTPQRDISITGVWGYRNDEATAGTLTASTTASATTVAVSDASTIGPGSLLRVGTERLLCTEATMVTTGVTVSAPGMTATGGNVTLPVSSGAGFTAGETVLVDSERMLIIDVVGNTLTVKRAWDGSVLAAHSAGVTVYAARSLTVTRGALGTTAAAHSSADQIHRFEFPGPVTSLTVAWAIVALGEESAGYTQSSGSGQRSTASSPTVSLAERVCSQYARAIRARAV